LLPAKIPSWQVFLDSPPHPLAPSLTAMTLVRMAYLVANKPCGTPP